MIISSDKENLNLDKKQPVMTIGNFDGLHKGHITLIKQIIKIAEKLKQPSLVLTFNPHPLTILKPDLAPERLSTEQQKADFFSTLGLDIWVKWPFDIKLASLKSYEFTENILKKYIHPQMVIIGSDFNYGTKGIANYQNLKDEGSSWGLKVEVLEQQSDANGLVYSSTEVRKALKTGAVELATHILGRPYRITGTVTAGFKRGQALGFPTANLSYLEQLRPAKGIYAGWAYFDQKKIAAMTSVGHNPTFGPAELTVEVHLLDVKFDLYGKQLSFDFCHRLRSEKRFSSKEELILQLKKDAQASKEKLAIQL